MNSLRLHPPTEKQVSGGGRATEQGGLSTADVASRFIRGIIEYCKPTTKSNFPNVYTYSRGTRPSFSYGDCDVWISSPYSLFDSHAIFFAIRAARVTMERFACRNDNVISNTRGVLTRASGFETFRNFAEQLRTIFHIHLLYDASSVINKYCNFKLYQEIIRIYAR